MLSQLLQAPRRQRGFSVDIDPAPLKALDCVGMFLMLVFDVFVYLLYDLGGSLDERTCGFDLFREGALPPDH